jgi:macrolide resistance protein
MTALPPSKPEIQKSHHRDGIEEKANRSSRMLKISSLAPPVRRAPLYGVILAGAFSMLGNAIASVALPWLVLSLTGNAVWTGVAAAAGMVPLVIGAFFGGPVADRFGSRVVAVTADTLSALSVAAIPFLFAYGQLGIGGLIALIVVGALLDGPGMVAHDARVPELARLAGLPIERVTAIDELLENASVIFGPPVAGVAIALLGVENALLITAGCSLIAALIGGIYLPRHRAKTARPDAGHPSLAGLRFLVGEPLLRVILLIAMVTLSVFGALNAVVLPALFRANGATALDLGLFLAVSGAGAAVAAIAFAFRGPRWNGRTVLLAGLLGIMLSLGLIAIDGATRVLWPAAALLGLSTGALAPLANALFLKRAPSAIRGSVLGATMAIAMVATPAAVLIAGFGVELFGGTLFLGGLSMIVGLLLCWACANRELKAVSRSPT